MTLLKSYAVVFKKSQWVVCLHMGSIGPLIQSFRTQEEAWKHCQTLARKARGTASLFKKNGTLRRTTSYEPAKLSTK